MELWKHRGVMLALVRREMSARYRGSLAGSVWTLAHPLLMMGAYFFVFGVVLRTRFGGDGSRSGFVFYFLAGMLPWLAFSEAVGRAPSVIVEYRSFAKKLVFPLEILPLNLVISGVLTELAALIVLACAAQAARGSLSRALVWLPVVLLAQMLITAGLCWALAATGVFVRDLGQAMTVVLTLWFFLTPICYPEASLPAGMAPLLGLNPMCAIAGAYRAILLESRAPGLRPLTGLMLAGTGLAWAGRAWFRRLRASFADAL